MTPWNFSVFSKHSVTSSTGLKISLDQALEPDTGDGLQAQNHTKAPAQVKKAKLRNRRPRRIPQYKEVVEQDNPYSMPSKQQSFIIMPEMHWGCRLDSVPSERGGGEITRMNPYSWFACLSTLSLPMAVACPFVSWLLQHGIEYPIRYLQW